MTAPPLGKYLASTEKKIRDKAITNLSVFLSESTHDISKPDMDKLWKGIFYGFWMSDKPLVQQALATELADLVLTIAQTSSALAFLRGFWEMIVREWNGIDRLRIDKYYMLVEYIANSPSDQKVPTSLAYHLADIYIEELNKVFAAFSTDISSHPLPAPLHTLLSPFLLLAAQTPLGVTYKRIQSALIGPILSALSSPSDDEEQPASKRARLTTSTSHADSYPHLVSNACYEFPKTEAKMDGPTLRKKLLRSVFEIASRPETRDSNRRKMYVLWKDGAGEEGEED
ncbi:hypothetical protein H0H87_012441 [Tephrocybe sp. NHM501043]|nr:hypothetical protein H0H87_012441 [Tephrocybe sp. NHM501043]